MNETVDKSIAVAQVRMMAYHFADLYFAFIDELRAEFGEEAAMRIAARVLYRRADERSAEMRVRAEKEGLAPTPDNISAVSDVPYLGWTPELGADHCPYGAQWKKRIVRNPWFERFAALYCDVTDTTIAEAFTGSYTHRLTSNVVNGSDSCERIYTPDVSVAEGRRTYKP